jgi:5-methylcytosine-specific restriction endonuclease McrA
MSVPHGYHPTAEARRKMSETHKKLGTIPPSAKGRKYGMEYRLKMSRALMGRKFTDEWKRKISEGNRGKKHTEETKKKLSEILKNTEHSYYCRLYIIHRCKQCGTRLSITVDKYLIGRGVYCNRKCEGLWRSQNMRGKNHPHWQERIAKKCLFCGKKVVRTPGLIRQGLRIFCSRGCRGKWVSQNCINEKAYNWQGGVSFLPYASGWTKRLKRAIKQRDNYTCQMCGGTNCDLDVHHKDYDKSNHAEDNLISLCKSCHGLTYTQRSWWIDYFLEI